MCSTFVASTKMATPMRRPGIMIGRATARLAERNGPQADHGRQGIFGAYGTEIPGTGFRVDGCYPGSAANLALWANSDWALAKAQEALCLEEVKRGRGEEG